MGMWNYKYCVHNPEHRQRVGNPHHFWPETKMMREVECESVELLQAANLLINNVSNGEHGHAHARHYGPFRTQPEKYLFWQDGVNGLQGRLYGLQCAAYFLHYAS